MNSGRKRVVFDTSTLVAVLLYPERIPAQAFRLAASGFEVCASSDTLIELVEVLKRDKFDQWRPIAERSDFVERYALRGGNCPDWIVPSGMQCKAQIAPRGHSHASNLQRGSAPAGGNPTGQFPPRKAYMAMVKRIGNIPPVADCRDPKDDKFLALALEAGADYIISSDEDLLVLNPYQGIPVIRPLDFLERCA